jgi:MoaA/NifB/PqqE/SkfB family radical SAM enzyme
VQIAEKPLLKIEASYEGKGIKLSPKGPLSPLAKPVMGLINRVFSEEKPISPGPDRFIFSTWVPPAPSLAFDRMLSAQVGSILGKKSPDQLSIAVIKACPNRCIHCSAPSRLGEVLSPEVVRKVISDGLDMGSYLITFDGGEPMLRQELPQMVASVDERAVATTFSSGYGLTPERAAELKRSGLYAVRISIDSPLEAEHDRVRGREDAFGDALSGIKNALESGLLVDMFMVTSPSNIDNLEEAYSLATDLGVHELSFYEIVAVGKWASHLDEVLSKDDAERLERFQKDKNSRAEGPRVTAFPYLLGEKMFGCFAGRRWAHIDASGDVLPCAYMPLRFGNIKDRSLEDIWKEMSRYNWFGKRCSCQMKDPSFREKHSEVISS